MEEEYLKRVMITSVLVVLAVLVFLITKPIILPLVFGLILVVVFAPMHDWLLKIVKSQTLSASIICVLLILVIVLPFWFLTPILIQQSFNIYQTSQQIDIMIPLKELFPSFFASDQFSNEISSIISNFITKVTNAFVNSLSQLIINFPTISLQFFVVFFTFFYVLRDKEYFIEYAKNIIPFAKDVKEKLFKSSKEMIFSVIFGQVFIGIIQGVAVSLGFFIFGINNAWLFSLLAVLAGIFPIIGTTIVWLPIVIYLFIAGNTTSAIGITFFGIFSNFIDNIIRPIFVSRFAHMHPLPILIGMVGGVFYFGILGFILGPLIIAYAFIMIEIYRGKQITGIFIHENLK